MFDKQFVRDSIVGEEGLNPNTVREGVIELNLVNGKREQVVWIDMADRAGYDANSYWVPLYFVENVYDVGLGTDEARERLTLVLRLSSKSGDDRLVEQLISPDMRLPYKAIAWPSKDKLTPATWFDNREEIRRQQTLRVGSVVALAAGLVANGTFAVRHRARNSN